MSDVLQMERSLMVATHYCMTGCCTMLRAQEHYLARCEKALELAQLPWVQLLEAHIQVAACKRVCELCSGGRA